MGLHCRSAIQSILNYAAKWDLHPTSFDVRAIGSGVLPGPAHPPVGATEATDAAASIIAQRTRDIIGPSFLFQAQ